MNAGGALLAHRDMRSYHIQPNRHRKWQPCFQFHLTTLEDKEAIALTN